MSCARDAFTLPFSRTHRDHSPHTHSSLPASRTSTARLYRVSSTNTATACYDSPKQASNLLHLPSQTHTVHPLDILLPSLARTQPIPSLRSYGPQLSCSLVHYLYFKPTHELGYLSLTTTILAQTTPLAITPHTLLGLGPSHSHLTIFSALFSLYYL